MATALTLNPSGGLTTATNAAKTFALVALPDSADGKTVGSLRINPTAPLGAPEHLRISHQVVKGSNGNPTVDRHLVRFDQTKPASGETPEATLSIYMNMVVPRSQITAAEVADGVGLVIDLLNNTDVLARLLANDPIADV